MARRRGGSLIPSTTPHRVASRSRVTRGQHAWRSRARSAEAQTTGHRPRRLFSTPPVLGPEKTALHLQSARPHPCSYHVPAPVDGLPLPQGPNPTSGHTQSSRTEARCRSLRIVHRCRTAPGAEPGECRCVCGAMLGGTLTKSGWPSRRLHGGTISGVARFGREGCIALGTRIGDRGIE